MYKILKFKTLLFAMVVSIIITSAPMTALAYTTNATVNNGEYVVYDNGVASGPGPTSVTTLALKEMRRKALLRWTYPGASSTYYYPRFGHNSPDKIHLYHWTDNTHVTRQQYRGILYELKLANYTDMTEASREHWLGSGESIENAITNMLSYDLPGPNEDETLSLRRSVRGTDCSSSACYAWRVAKLGSNDRTNGLLMIPIIHNNKFCYTYTCEKIFKDGNDYDFNIQDGYANFIDRVGDYSPNGNFTDSVLYNLGNSVYNNVYAEIQPGDFLVQYTSAGSHTRLVEKVVIIRNNDNSIDPYQSYVVITDQTSTMRDCTNNAYSENEPEKKYYKTTWHVGYNGGKYDSTHYRYNFYKLAGGITGDDSPVFYLPYRYNGNTATIVTGFIPGDITEGKIEINWNEQSPKYCNGFELVYATDPDFKDAKTVVFDTSKKNSYTLKNLEKCTYYIKMRAYNFHKDGEIEYSGYNNWLRINPQTKEIYRQNAPDPTTVSQQEYKAYVYDDVSYGYNLD